MPEQTVDQPIPEVAAQPETDHRAVVVGKLREEQALLQRFMSEFEAHPDAADKRTKRLTSNDEHDIGQTAAAIEALQRGEPVYQDLYTVWDTLDRSREEHFKGMLRAAHQGEEGKRAEHASFATSFGHMSLEIGSLMDPSQKTFMPLMIGMKRLARSL